MTYRAIWYDDHKVVAEDRFEDLWTAQDFVLQHFATHGRSLRAARVRVCDDACCYFSLEHPREAVTAECSEEQHKVTAKVFSSGLRIKLMGPEEVAARVDWRQVDERDAQRARA